MWFTLVRFLSNFSFPRKKNFLVEHFLYHASLVPHETHFLMTMSMFVYIGLLLYCVFYLMMIIFAAEMQANVKMNKKRVTGEKYMSKYILFNINAPLENTRIV